VSVYKLVFTGPVGAGKTSSIAAISDVPPVTTEETANEKINKASTTVALDYGKMKLANGELIHLYGTPGQARFDFMWKILSEGSLGLVILIRNDNPDPIEELHGIAKPFNHFFDTQSVVIGITHMDRAQRPTLDDYRRAVIEYQFQPAIFEIDANRKEDVLILVQALLYTMDPCLDQTA